MKQTLPSVVLGATLHGRNRRAPQRLPTLCGKEYWAPTPNSLNQTPNEGAMRNLAHRFSFDSNAKPTLFRILYLSNGSSVGLGLKSLFVLHGNATASVKKHWTAAWRQLLNW